MVSITLSVPLEVKERMDQFSEINWSGFIRRQIIEKTSQLSWKEEMQKKLKKDQAISSWALGLTKSTRASRLKKLKSKGLV